MAKVATVGEKLERAYIRGAVKALLRIRQQIDNELKGYGVNDGGHMGPGERIDTVHELRDLCERFGLSNEWSNELYLVDVIDKHVGRSLAAKIGEASKAADEIHVLINEYRACIAIPCPKCGAKFGTDCHDADGSHAFPCQDRRTDCGYGRTKTKLPEEGTRLDGTKGRKR